MIRRSRVILRNPHAWTSFSWDTSAVGLVGEPGIHVRNRTRNSTGDSDGQPGMGSSTLAWAGVLSRLSPEMGYAHAEVEGRGCFRVSCFSKCGPQTSSISITWESVRNANSWALPLRTESETQRMGAQCLKSLPRWFWYPVKFETTLLKEDQA